MATLAIANILFLTALVIRSSSSAPITTMTVTHTLLVSFKPSASRETIQPVSPMAHCNNRMRGRLMLLLQDLQADHRVQD